MMTPADEMEQIIKEIVIHDDIDPRYSYSYSIKAFPEIFLLKHTFYYTVEILEDHRQNADIIKKYEKLRDELESRKITIENHILDKDRNIVFHIKSLRKHVPIYYKDCAFTDHYIFNGDNCENCIVEKDET